jgi:hypothetical protein
MVSRDEIFPKVALKRLYAVGDYFAETDRNAWPLVLAVKAIFNKNSVSAVHRLYRASGENMKEPAGYYFDNWRGKHQIFINPRHFKSGFGYAALLLHEFLHHLTQIFLTECSFCPHRCHCPAFRATPEGLTRLAQVAIDTLA